MMIATECPSAEELRALSTGRLADERSDELLEHIRGCETCRSALETVADGEDSLIASLRAPDALASFDAEPGCKLAMAKALGALAIATDKPTDAERGYLPTTIGEYEIVRPLGSGGMGSVFLARHTKLGRQVALKLLAGHRLGDPRMRERFEAEMRAVGRLSHPNIVTAHDAREIDGTAVLVTEYIDGFDLGQLVARTGPLAIADACEIVRQVAAALAYTSGQGFVHRDVKPSNIMLSRSGEVKLLDLGLARFQLEELDQVGMTGTGQTMGTADYVAPEQVADSRSVDVRADIYSLGCTLFKLLCGVPPFADAEHATAFAKMTAHVSEAAPSLAERLPQAPSGLVKLVASMLAKEPPKRPQSPQAVAEQLAPFTQDCDLERLAARAETLEPTNAPTHAQPTAKPRLADRTRALLRRRLPLLVASGGGIAGILLGLVFGILIKIEYPDGTEVSVPVPPGSKVTLAELPSDSEPHQHQLSAPPKAAASAPTATQATLVSPPLQFAILVNEADLSETDPANGDLLREAKEALAESEHGGPVVTDVGTWYPVAPDSGVSPTAILANRKGQVYALAFKDPSGTVGWEKIRGHVKASVQSEIPGPVAQLELNFGRALTERMREFTKNHLGRQLALIRDNQVISAKRLRSEFGSREIFTGNFASEEIRTLQAALGHLRVETSQGIRAKAVDDGDTAAAVKSLQGLWQVTEISVRNNEPLPRTELVWGFQGQRYYICSSQFPTSGGTFWVSKENPGNSHSSIEFRDELPRDMLLPNPRGIYLVHGGHQVSMALNLMLHDLSSSIIAAEDLFSPSIRYHLNRLGKVPQTSEEAIALAKGKDEDLADAIMTTFDAMQVPPSSLAPPQPDRVESAAKQYQTRENLRAIGRAFSKFHEAHQKLPGSINNLEGAMTPPSGKPILPFSWRVAILPHIGESELHRQYRFEEPWDSEHNRTLLSKMPNVYQSPYRGETTESVPAGETHYQGFVGEQTALGRTFSEIEDGTSRTLLIVESRAAVPWTKPEDLPFEKPEDAKAVKPFESVPLNFLIADGSVRQMDPVDWEKLAKLITRNGGEPVQY